MLGICWVGVLYWSRDYGSASGRGWRLQPCLDLCLFQPSTLQQSAGRRAGRSCHVFYWASQMRETLSAKNMQIKEMQLKHVQIEQECDSLRRTEVRFQTYKRDQEELQQALQDEQIWVHKKANGFSVERTKDKKKHLSQEEMDSPLKSLAAAEASIASKDAQLIEIEMERERRKTSIEDLQHKHLKLEQELERVLLLLDDAEKHRAKSVRQTTNLELQLAHASLFGKRCEGRQKFIQVWGFAVANTQQQIREDGAKEGWQRSFWVRKAVRNHRGTQRRRNYCNDLRNRFQRRHIILKKHGSLIFNLDSSLSSGRTPLLVQSLRAQEASKKRVAERLDIEKLKKRAHLLYRSSITKVATRDVSIGFKV